MTVVVRSHRRLVLALAVLAVAMGLGALAATGGLVVALVRSAADGGLGSGPVLLAGFLAGVLAMGAMVLVLSGAVVRRSDHQRLTEAVQAAGLGTADVGRLWSGRPAPTDSGVLLTPTRRRGRLELHAD
ncbi:hypothetical protein [Klenkia taihuensis]|uniref:Uncharacterized protein n=1 Tax=Klenkia taihuensis TaxID=1225127 RepID=A0A1I1M9W2_9ACTN|nr:hypothetical protein [Klenkia taihuensis]GHE14165.1 hypothetical protein GCM10011381_39520 [Klenkia taihuensis]SFC82307.1 hypothetical protein SAMN05661030_1616 [Klenkia taihuensis]